MTEDRQYFYQDEESGTYEVGGEPTEQERRIGQIRDNEAGQEYDPERHNSVYDV